MELSTFPGPDAVIRGIGSRLLEIMPTLDSVIEAKSTREKYCHLEDVRVCVSYSKLYKKDPNLAHFVVEVSVECDEKYFLGVEKKYTSSGRIYHPSGKQLRELDSTVQLQFLDTIRFGIDWFGAYYPQDKTLKISLLDSVSSKGLVVMIRRKYSDTLIIELNIIFEPAKCDFELPWQNLTVQTKNIIELLNTEEGLP